MDILDYTTVLIVCAYFFASFFMLGKRYDEIMQDTKDYPRWIKTILIFIFLLIAPFGNIYESIRIRIQYSNMELKLLNPKSGQLHLMYLVDFKNCGAKFYRTKHIQENDCVYYLVSFKVKDKEDFMDKFKSTQTYEYVVD